MQREKCVSHSRQQERQASGEGRVTKASATMNECKRFINRKGACSRQCSDISTSLRVRLLSY